MSDLPADRFRVFLQHGLVGQRGRLQPDDVAVSELPNKSHNAFISKASIENDAFNFDAGSGKKANHLLKSLGIDFAAVVEEPGDGAPILRADGPHVAVDIYCLMRL